ncbi:MAG: twin-arginine translocase subunit TatC [Thermoflexales bacterium]|nr:twin-arginine translocase subunit TatC [Thermoflexales bacterium]
MGTSAPVENGEPETEAANGMSFFDHLRELRTRLIRIFIGLVIGAGISLLFTEPLLRVLIRPYGHALKVIGPTESVSIYLRVAVMSGAALAMPYILWQLWGFITPGLLPHERRYVYILIPAASGLFLIGMTFAWFLMAPAAINFLSSFSPGIFETEWTSELYIPFITSMLFWIGVSFEMPLIIFFLAKLHIVNARMLLHSWRYAVIVIAVIAAAITPTVDPFNMALVMAPLIALYFISVALAALA